MPNYEYRCAKCGETFEVLQSFSDAPLTRHPDCGGKVAKVLSSAGFVLKGSGFYKNDSGSRSTSRRPKKADATTTSATPPAAESGTSKKESSASSGDSKPASAPKKDAKKPASS